MPDQSARLRRAAEAVRVLRARVAALEGDRRSPVAIVGMGCRFPGGADHPDALWEMLQAGRVGTTGVPPDRWSTEGWYDPERGTAGRAYVRSGGFLREDVFAFDPRAFGLSEAEATAMDPMHRLLLEVQHEALEHAGIAPRSLAGRSVGVFVGIAHSEHKLRVHDQGPSAVDAWSGTGNTSAAAVGRLAYVLGTHGPTLAVDTACSASLVALDLAVRALRERTCDLAVVGGVNVLLDPDAFVYLCAIGALAPDGRSKSFDAAADGYGRGEGCGVVVLERLDDAERGARTVHAVVRGTAVNHDGRSNGLTAPSGPAQEQVLRAALVDAGADAAEVGYIECHGTGTPLGDPIEAGALRAVYGAGPVLGAVKANLGHLEAAAGVAGLIKATLALSHGVVPPQPNFGSPSPHLAPETRVAVAATPFDGLAATSAFGIGGTNAHAILGPAAPPVQTPDALAWLPLSARTAEGLERLRSAWLDHLTDGSWADAAHTARVGRDGHRHRLSVVATDRSDARQRLEEAEPTVATDAPRVALAFTGQGAQHGGMGLALAEAFPVYSAALDRCAAVLEPLLGRSLRDLLEDDEALRHTAMTQPALFAVEWALAELWRSWGLRPDAVVGHSIGEWVAAVVAGVVPLEDALVAVVERGRRMGELPPGGAMAAIRRPVAEVEPLLPAGAAVAAVNHPGETVISGDAEAVESVAAGFEGSRLLRVSHAFHSPRMEPAVEGFAEVVADLPLREPRLPFPSNRTGRLETEAWTDPEHWAASIRAPVRFADCLAALDVDLVLEVGPRPVLTGFVDGPAVPSLRRGVEPVRSLLGAAAALWGAGVELDRAATGSGRIVDVPRTPWDRRHLAITPVARPEDAYSVAWVAAPSARRALGATVIGTGPLADALRARVGAGPDVVWVDPGGEALDRCDALRLALQSGSGRLVLVTQRSDVEPGAAALAGMLRCAALELPERRVVHVDVGSPDDVPAAVGLLGLDEPAWRVRDGVARVARLHRHVVPAAPASVTGTWAITGGTGALGLALAERLVASGATRIRLGSRSGRVEPSRLEAIRAPVDVVALDAADAEALTDFVEGCAGVVHAAGVLADVTLPRLTRGHLERALHGKLGGALALAECVPDAVPLVLYGSMAGTTGSPGQAAYAAANAALDAVASARVARGGRALCVAWGPWGGGGMAADTLGRRSAQGIRPLQPEAALTRLEQLLAGEDAAVVVADVDWPTAVAAVQPTPPLLADLAPHAEASVGTLRERIESAVARSLGLELPVPSDRGLVELGMDSLQALELAGALGRLTEEPVSRTVAFDHPTIDALVAHLGGEASEAVAPSVGGPSALVGWACRLPDGIAHPLTLWERWRAGASTAASSTRWEADAPGGPRVHGGFIDDPWSFDADFFGIPPAEAVVMDPQQRLLLELTWEALADAGLDPEAWRGRRVGVFVGIGGADHTLLLDRAGLLGDALFAGSGNDPSFAAGRVAFTFGFTGPTLVVQAACPSALVAAHLARRSLADGECELAIVAGVHLSLAPEPFADAAAGEALSSDGQTRSYQSQADGYGRSEGAVVLVLAPEGAGLPARARLVGTAVEHGGRTASLTAPAGPPQSRAARSALAGREPSEVAYVEGHGTASPQGDAIEIGALAEVYPEAVLGSVKTLVGNPEAASGALGLLAAALVLHHGTAPGCPGPASEALEATGLRLSTGEEPIAGLAAVNAYGLSGTTAHAVLEAGDAAPRAAVALPFQRRRHHFGDRDAPRGRRLDGPLPTWERLLHPDHEHRVHGQSRVAAAVWLRWVLAVAEGQALAQVVLHAPTDLTRPRRARLTLLPDGSWQIAVRGVEWTRVVSGILVAATPPEAEAPVEGTAGDVEALYRSFHDGGQEFGPGYRALASLRLGDARVEGRLSGGTVEGRWDAGMQLRAALAPPGVVFLPTSVDRAGGDPSRADRVVLRVQPSTEDTWVSDVRWLAGDRVVAWLDGQLSRPAVASERRLEARDGALDGLAWAGVEPTEPGPGEVAVRVDAAGLNFRDVLQALGAYPGAQRPLGAECVGTIVAVGSGVELDLGERVCGFGAGSLASRVVLPAAGVAPTQLPDAVAATTPVAWLTAWVALHHIARLQPGERVLVHAAAGGVGLAATRVARALGAEVWGTAHPRKHGVLRDEGVTRIGSSRDPDWGSTFEGGVDVVLNSLVGPFIDASLALLRPGGRFVEIGKRDLRDQPVPGYSVFDLGAWADADPAALQAALQHVLGQVGQAWSPLPVRTFAFDEVSDAFRHLAAAAHIGKVALVRGETQRQHRAVTALPLELRAIEERVAEEVRAILGLERRPPIDQPLRDIGLGSLASLELRNRLAVASGRELPATLVFAHPTIRSLAEALAPDDMAPSTEALPEDADALLAELDAELAALD